MNSVLEDKLTLRFAATTTPIHCTIPSAYSTTIYYNPTIEKDLLRYYVNRNRIGVCLTRVRKPQGPSRARFTETTPLFVKGMRSLEIILHTGGKGGNVKRIVAATLLRRLAEDSRCSSNGFTEETPFRQQRQSPRPARLARPLLRSSPSSPASSLSLLSGMRDRVSWSRPRPMTPPGGRRTGQPRVLLPGHATADCPTGPWWTGRGSAFPGRRAM